MPDRFKSVFRSTARDCHDKGGFQVVELSSKRLAEKLQQFTDRVEAPAVLELENSLSMLEFSRRRDSALRFSAYWAAMRFADNSATVCASSH